MASAPPSASNPANGLPPGLAQRPPSAVQQLHGFRTPPESLAGGADDVKPDTAAAPPVSGTPSVPSSKMYTDAGSAMPQYSASTQEILKRVSAENTFSAGSPEWEAAREKVLGNMSLSNHIRAPYPAALAGANGARAGAASPARGRGVARGAAASPVRTPTRGRGRVGRPPGRGRGRGSSRGRGRGGKRKREDDEEASNDDDDDDSDASNSYTPLTTVTKSGRNVTKPSQYKPVETDSPTGEPKRRRSYYRRGPEFSTLCVKCQRGHSPPSNAIVFCDGCNSAYHQWCHDPHIPKDVVEVAEKEWVCGKCQHVRETEQLRIEDRVSGQELTPEEKAAYLSSLSSHTLVALLLSATSLHPDLPVFAPDTRAFLKSNASLLSSSSSVSIPTPPTSHHQPQPQPYMQPQPQQQGNIQRHPPAPSAPTPQDSNASANHAYPAPHSSLSSSTATTHTGNSSLPAPDAPPPTAPNTSNQAPSRSDTKPGAAAGGGEDTEDPYPDYSTQQPVSQADPPATYPRPGHGPIKIQPATDAEGMHWLVDDDNEFGAFAHLAAEPASGSGPGSGQGAGSGAGTGPGSGAGPGELVQVRRGPGWPLAASSTAGQAQHAEQRRTANGSAEGGADAHAAAEAAAPSGAAAAGGA